MDDQQTTDQPEVEPASPRRLQDVGSVRRPRDDRMIAGVSTAVARWWNIDPVIVRIGFVVLAFIGLAGFILYAAAWLLLPEEGKDRSVLGEAFGLGENDVQVRTVGLISAAVLAAAAVLGDSAWGFGGWGWAAVWIVVSIGLPVAFLYWLFKGRHDARAQTPPPDASAPRPQTPRRAWSPALFLGTVSVTLIAWGALWIWSLQTDPIAAPVYALVGLVITAVGLLVGSIVGDAGVLIPVGLVLVALLTVTAALPSARTGDFRFTPVDAEQATRSLTTGAGQVTYDLTAMRDLDDLAGEAVRIEHGTGMVRVIVPRELDVAVDARVRWGGQVTVFDRREDGWDTRLDVPGKDNDAFAIEITSTLGVIEVIRS
ncbi:PspC domain-containing protein [uncultured Aeromicrobium sp.]|uniref:PspC domain-containing protein n=1 Tax=uncultured Aeromicrobium sp. TaxID=337820 RepID=UPI0025CBB4A3|nr:PspC domain-containing protein [uncultured Aeromicrobium sp.]